MDLSKLGQNGSPFSNKRKEQLEKQWVENAKRIKNKIDAILEEENAGLVPRLMIGADGINPYVVVLPTPAHKDFEEMGKLGCQLNVGGQPMPPVEEGAK